MENTEVKLTEYQAGQLLHIHFYGDFKYRLNSGTRVPSAQWRKMIDTLTSAGYIKTVRSGITITPAGRAYLDAHHLEIKTLN